MVVGSIAFAPTAPPTDEEWMAHNVAEVRRWGAEQMALQSPALKRWKLDAARRALAEAEARAALLRESIAFLEGELGG